MRTLVPIGLIAILLAGCARQGSEERLRVATAANFGPPARELAALYESETGQGVDIIVGATGTLFSQIAEGAPFDVYLAADTLRPFLLDSLGVAIEGSRFTYARGRLVLWAKRREDLTPEALRGAPGKRLAMANPRLAPYGRAAQELLIELGLYADWEERIVMGESVAQAFQFARTRSVDLGLVAESQVHDVPGGYWPIPDSLYGPILQQAVQLTAHPHAEPFLNLLRERGDVLAEYGFRPGF